MVVTRTDFGAYHSLSGTEAEVLQALSDLGVSTSELVRLNDTATFAVYRRGL